jgi:benzoate/toluate 1,2-dioxygenase alpha subunit
VTYCIAPKGESREARTRRIRQYEEFFNPSGLATPDDTTIFEDCQAAPQAEAVDWYQGYMRGLAVMENGPNEHARELGINPLTSIASAFGLGDETIFHGPWREWRRRLGDACAVTRQPRRVAAGAAS